MRTVPSKHGMQQGVRQLACCPTSLLVQNCRSDSKPHRGSWTVCMASKKRKGSQKKRISEDGTGTTEQVAEKLAASPQTAVEGAIPASASTDCVESPVQLSRNGKPVGWSFFPGDDVEQPAPEGSTKEEMEAGVQIDLVASSTAAAEGEPLPAVSKGQVFRSCLQVSLIFAVAGFFLRLAAQTVGVTAMHNDAALVDRLLQFPDDVPPQHWAVMLGSAAVVTVARQLLLQQWPAFASATNKSNKQILSPLTPLDLVWLAALSGASEEFLFRGGLIPALLPDWRGVLLSGAAFGVLHNSGGRNLAFAAWAGVVGVVYGYAFLYTEDIYVPMGAHSLANLAAAVLWLQAHDWSTAAKR
ncbi:hypothetical protein WJX72_008579 [[Myrmecia] bisecta]|uniref:CAAX prenyl protease 2/Lysostaphin resistance protein A-like domain-containing protein n=1 Tax=[Myrmecia] bisecta TaxID=41462 RepID=A0AAW1QFS9_9CHLO